MPQIHPTAVVSSGAQLDETVRIGAYSIIGPHVSIKKETEVMPHVFIDGYTTIGEACTIFPFASIGTQTQDLKFKGGHPNVEIGDHTTLREYVTVNTATNDGDCTHVGSKCHIMAYAHIAHDCEVGNEVIIANCGTLAGHVIIEDQAIIGGLSGIHQFVRIGRLSIIGGCSKVTKDVPPFMLTDGHPLVVRGINSVGLERRGLDKKTQRNIKTCYKILYRNKLTTKQAVERIRTEIDDGPEVKQLLSFIQSPTRGIA
ncbi:MAG: acyl-ACP--UDP-N-acetylglucosamine O-acyltransferase [Kiritimatiellae bacterium]|nr:acyl-ACP--UDP-N-acetylglucosamine O-acyltransferase [Kiritimatiellia bacterium]